MCCSNCFFISCDVFLIYCVALVELSIYIDKADKYKAFFLSRLNSCFPLLFFCIPYQISNWTLSCLPSPPSSFLPFSTHLPFHDNWTFIDRVTVSALNPRGIFHHPPGFFLLHTWIISCPLHPLSSLPPFSCFISVISFHPICLSIIYSLRSQPSSLCLCLLSSLFWTLWVEHRLCQTFIKPD